MEGPGLQHRADLTHGVPNLVKPAAVEPRLTASVVEVQHQPHRRRLARAVRAEEASNHTGPDLERKVVDGSLVAVSLRQPIRHDHRATPRSKSCHHAAAATWSR